MLFFNDTATTEIYTLSLHDALPILVVFAGWLAAGHDGVLDIEPNPAGDRNLAEIAWRAPEELLAGDFRPAALLDRKSTRLNSSHANISYAVFCLKKKKHLMIIAIRQ